MVISFRCLNLWGRSYRPLLTDQESSQKVWISEARKCLSRNLTQLLCLVKAQPGSYRDMYFSVKKSLFPAISYKLSLESPWLPCLCVEQEGWELVVVGRELRVGRTKLCQISDELGSRDVSSFPFHWSTWHVMPALSFTSPCPNLGRSHNSHFQKRNWSPEKLRCQSLTYICGAKSLTYICLVSKTGTLLGSLRGEWACRPACALVSSSSIVSMIQLKFGALSSQHHFS